MATPRASSSRSDRKIRERNKLNYRFNHWPIWIFVFFIAPGPLTFDLFEHGFDWRMALWLGAVLVGTGIAGLRGALPGVEPAPYIIRFTEDRPNPLYRRVCYTFAWSEVDRVRGAQHRRARLARSRPGEWYLKQIYDVAYFPIAGTIWVLGALGSAAAREGVDQGRRARAPVLLRIGVGGLHRAAGAVAAVEGAAAQTRACDTLKLVVFVGILAFVGNLARLGVLPRTRPIVPGELAVSD